MHPTTLRTAHQKLISQNKNSVHLSKFNKQEKGQENRDKNCKWTR